MIVHLIDGTYELYRQHFGQAVRHSSPPPLAATRGVVTSTLQLLVGGATHVTVAVDHVIESFRNQMYEGYKTSDGMEAEILEQIPLMEDALRALGVPVWPMVKYEADDGLAAGALIASLDDRVDQVQMITPDKDLGQCVVGNRVVQYDRRNDLIVNETAIIEKFGVGPASIADWLGLVGDTADGFPGLPGWGAKSATSVLAKYLHIGDIPDDEAQWATDGVAVRGAAKLAATLRDQRPMAELFKQVATVVTDVSDDVPLGFVDDWEWRGPTKDLGAIAKQLNMTDLVERTERAMVGRRS
jgi:5'-3' exonuclease